MANRPTSVSSEKPLLPGFVLDDVRNLLGLDRRQLDEPRQTALAGNAYRNAVPADGVARQECLQGLAHQLDRVRIRLAEDLRILDEVECIGRHAAVIFVRPAAQRLERTLADINAPNGVVLRHEDL